MEIGRVAKICHVSAYVAYEHCEPVYKIFDGWESSTIGTTSYDQLPSNACHYLEWIEDELNISIDIISTGPDREQTIIKRNPFS